jgi:hypothetical protein
VIACSPQSQCRPKGPAIAAADVFTSSPRLSVSAFRRDMRSSTAERLDLPIDDDLHRRVLKCQKRSVDRAARARTRSVPRVIRPVGDGAGPPVGRLVQRMPLGDGRGRKKRVLTRLNAATFPPIANANDNTIGAANAGLRRRVRAALRMSWMMVIPNPSHIASRGPVCPGVGYRLSQFEHSPLPDRLSSTGSDRADARRGKRYA